MSASTPQYISFATDFRATVSSWVFEAAHLLTRLDSNVQLYCDIQIAAGGG
jgi:hypothetical protein